MTVEKERVPKKDIRAAESAPLTQAVINTEMSEAYQRARKLVEQDLAIQETIFDADGNVKAIIIKDKGGNPIHYEDFVLEKQMLALPDKDDN
jgi:hypothetical protein